MLKKFTLVFLMVALCCAGKTKLIGGVGSGSLSSYLSDPAYQASEEAARTFYETNNLQSKSGLTLGQVTAISSQVVSGINFYITFATDSAKLSVICLVWAQSWIDKYNCKECVYGKVN